MVDGSRDTVPVTVSARPIGFFIFNLLSAVFSIITSLPPAVLLKVQSLELVPVPIVIS